MNGYPSSRSFYGRITIICIDVCIEACKVLELKETRVLCCYIFITSVLNQVLNYKGVLFLKSLNLISGIATSLEGILGRLKSVAWQLASEEIGSFVDYYMPKTNKLLWLTIRQPRNLDSQYERCMKAGFNMFISVNILVLGRISKEFKIKQLQRMKTT